MRKRGKGGEAKANEGGMWREEINLSGHTWNLTGKSGVDMRCKEDKQEG